MTKTHFDFQKCVFVFMEKLQVFFYLGKLYVRLLLHTKLKNDKKN